MIDSSMSQSSRRFQSMVDKCLRCCEGSHAAELVWLSIIACANVPGIPVPPEMKF